MNPLNLYHQAEHLTDIRKNIIKKKK